MPQTLPEAEVLCLDDFDTLDVARMDVFVPGGIRPIGWIEFAGPGHPKAIELSNESQRRTLREARERLIKGNRWKPADKTPEQVNEETAKWVADRVVGWSIKARALDESGNPVVTEVEFTHHMAMKLFSDPRKVWLLNAAAEFLVSVENFMPASSRP